jgi:ATP-dependent DNA helicase PIF1
MAVLNRLECPERYYYAADSIKETENAGVTPPSSILDYVIHHTPHGMPPHTLRVKVGGVYRLMRNLSVDRGLVKNVKVIVVGVGPGNRLITVRLLRLTEAGQAATAEDIFIPRITFLTDLHSGYTLCRLKSGS